jgi:hypothetical protein
MHADPSSALGGAGADGGDGSGGSGHHHHPFEWSICPGAAESACMSAVPHGTIITAASFTSLSLLHCALAEEEKVQYEVHLLTGGLLQCGWCVAPSGLPFSGQEGVGDFPMSVAADGLRGLVWSLTSVDVPELRWAAGDTLSCYADLATGAFDFALNGVHCHSASLPTKALLLRHGARWYNDRHSTDEMLQYTPAMSLEGGEACVVNLGEAPMCYPRRGYRTICETFWYAVEEGHSKHAAATGGGGVGTTYTRSGSPATVAVTGDAVAGGHAHATTPTTATTAGAVAAVFVASVGADTAGRGSNPNSNTSAIGPDGTRCCLTLGGVEMSGFIKTMGLLIPTGAAVPVEGTYLFFKTLDSWIEEPTRVVDRCARLVSWLQADAQTRWRAFTVWLYLWITRFYMQLRDVSEIVDEPQNLDRFVLPHPCIDAPTPAETLALLDEIWHALELFMPPASFALIPGMVLSMLQHRCGSADVDAQRLSMRIAVDLVSLRSFRRTWVADTVSFTSTLLNLFTIRAQSSTQREALAKAMTTHTPDDFITQPALTGVTCERQTWLWQSAAQVLDVLVGDTACRGALSVAMLRCLNDKRLHSTMAMAHRSTDASNEVFLDAYPYTFASAFSPIVVGVLTLSLAAALGRCMPPLSEDDLSDSPAAAAAFPPSSTTGADADTAATLVAVHETNSVSQRVATVQMSTDAAVAVAAPSTGSRAVLERQLSWRAVALEWLPPARFYSRPLATPVTAVAGCEGDTQLSQHRLGGSLQAVSASIEAEMNLLTEKFTSAPPPAKRRASRTRSSRVEEASASTVSAPACKEHDSGLNTAEEEEGEEESVPVSLPSRQFIIPAEGEAACAQQHARMAAQEQQWRAVAAMHLARRGLFTSLPTNVSGLGSATAMPPAQLRRVLEEAVAERADELFLVTVLAFDTYVRGLLARCASLPSATYQAVVAYQRSVNDKAASLEAWSSNNSVTSVTGRDEVAHVRHVFELLLTTVPLTTDCNSTALAQFGGTVGRVYSYYWARMAVFERCFCMPDTAAATEPRCRDEEREAAEAPHAPPRAFLMLPAQLSNVWVDVWLLVGLVRGHNADLAQQAPTLFRCFFDANMRRATSNLFAREYLYQAAASVLGANPQDRLCVAQQIAAMHRENPAEGPGKLSFVARHFADFLGVAQRSPGERTPVNFFSSLLLEERIFVPPPRMLDEKFGWLLHTQAQMRGSGSSGNLQTKKNVTMLQRSVPESDGAATTSADDIYLRLFCECTAQYTPASLLFPFIYQCNALLSRLSELMPPSPPCWTGATKESISTFFTLYHTLRKTLCTVDVVCEALLCSFPPTSAGGAACCNAADTAARAAAVAAAKRILLTSSSSSDACGSDAVAEEDNVALQRELMDVLLQCLLRLTRPALPPPPSSAPASASPAAALSLALDSPQTKLHSPPAAVAADETQALVEATKDEDDNDDSNVLQPAVVCDVNGTYHWREVGCTKAALLAPVFAILLRLLEVYGTARSTNVFLAAIGTELPSLVQAAQAALAHTTWWCTAAKSGTDEPRLPAKLRCLQGYLSEVEAAWAAFVPMAAAPSRPDTTLTTNTTTTTTTTITANTTHLSASSPSNQHDPSRTSDFSRSLSSTSNSTAECLSNPPLHADDVGRTPGARSSFSQTSSARVGLLRSPQGLPNDDRSGRGIIDDDEESEDEEGEGDGDSAEMCHICLSRASDARMLPCGHMCCYGCYRRYQRFEHARQVATEGSGHTWGTARTPSPPLTANGSHANSEASAACSVPSAQTSSDYHGRVTTAEVEQPLSSSCCLQVLTEDSITLSSVEQSIAAAESTAVRCFFCKEVVESVERVVRRRT